MKKSSVTIWLVLVLLVATGDTRADFTLYNDEQLTVNSFHSKGLLYNTSRAFIVSGGNVVELYPYDYSAVNISGGNASYLYTYNYSTANMSGGNASYLKTYGYSTANISGGTVSSPFSCNYSTVNMSGGYMFSLDAEDYSTANISGGTVRELRSSNYSTVNISGGFISSFLHAYDFSTVTFYGQNFLYGSGLTLDGTRVLGEGALSGEWLDGTQWAVNINTHHSTATILAIPEPATLLLLGLGAVILRRKRR